MYRYWQFYRDLVLLILWNSYTGMFVFHICHCIFYYRFQDTVRMLKDYYRGMEGKIPDQLPSEYARIPLIEVSASQLFYVSVTVKLTA